jgi:hypothetical protein
MPPSSHIFWTIPDNGKWLRRLNKENIYVGILNNPPEGDRRVGARILSRVAVHKAHPPSNVGIADGETH